MAPITSHLDEKTETGIIFKFLEYSLIKQDINCIQVTMKEKNISSFLVNIQQYLSFQTL